MARYVDAVDLDMPIEEAFDFMADFSRTVEWDPGVVEAQRLTRGEIGVGSRFAVTVSLLGRRIPFEYRITKFERPFRLELIGGDSSLLSVDEITFEARSGTTRITYEARLELFGLRRIAEPILAPLFQLIGRLAMRGLRERLSEWNTRPPTRDVPGGMSQQSEPPTQASRSSELGAVVGPPDEVLG